MKIRQIARMILAAALASALLLPATAFGLTRPLLGSRATSSTVTAMTGTREERRAEIAARIEERLRLRRQRFDAAEKGITARIRRVTELANRVEAAGGDVSGISTQLEAATAALDEAAAIEARAVEQWRAVPDATDKRAAVLEAKATGHEAVLKLRESRQTLRQVTEQLRAMVRSMKAGGDA